MGESEFQGIKADALRARASNLEHVLLAEGGGREVGEVDGKHAVFNSSSFAFETGDPEYALTADLFDTPAERADFLARKGVGELIYQRGWAVHPPTFQEVDIPTNMSGSLLLAAARGWLAEVDDGSVSLEKLQERDLEVGMLDQLAKHRVARKQLLLKGSASRPPVLKDWPGVGHLDLEIETSRGPVWAELKWAKSAEYLHNCLWDAAKVATAVREGAASAGYLVAGAPVSAWHQNVDYARVFEFSAFEHGEITNQSDRFAKSWNFWREENQNTYPVKIAIPVCTWPEGAIRSTNTGGVEPWEIRVARVTAPGQETWPTPHEIPVVPRKGGA